MQLFPCPSCGERTETEFHYLGEAGKTRPDASADAAVWAHYLHGAKNPRGATRELWLHLACGEVFALARDTVSMAVAGSESLHRDDEA